MTTVHTKDALETPAEPPQTSLAHDATPSDTTVTLPTPSQSPYAQLACHNPPRFIFYPISWDGSEDLQQGKKYIDDGRLNSPSAVSCSMDAFWSIDRWRRDVVNCGGAVTGDLLDPIHDADTPLPLLSLPHDHHVGGTQLRPTDGNGSEHDSVQLWIHP